MFRDYQKIHIRDAMQAPRGFGKTTTTEQMIADHIRKNPKATIVRVKPGGTRVEEYIGGNKDG